MAHTWVTGEVITAEKLNSMGGVTPTFILTRNYGDEDIEITLTDYESGDIITNIDNVWNDKIVDYEDGNPVPKDDVYVKVIDLALRDDAESNELSQYYLKLSSTNVGSGTPTCYFKSIFGELCCTGGFNPAFLYTSIFDEMLDL